MINFADFLKYYEEHENEIFYDIERRLSRTAADLERIDPNVSHFVSSAAASISVAVLQQYHNWLLRSLQELGRDE